MKFLYELPGPFLLTSVSKMTMFTQYAGESALVGLLLTGALLFNSNYPHNR
jgi:hypothetical protein